MSQVNTAAPPAAKARTISRPMPFAPAVTSTRCLSPITASSRSRGGRPRILARALRR
jgi:hypothetical protein